MTNRYAITNSTASAELAADQGDCRDKKVLQALVTPHGRASRCCRSDNSSRRGAGHQADSADHDEPAGKRVIARRGLRPSHAIRSIASEM
jgi:hypothetical protein